MGALGLLEHQAGQNLLSRADLCCGHGLVALVALRRVIGEARVLMHVDSLEALGLAQLHESRLLLRCQTDEPERRGHSESTGWRVAKTR